MLGFLPYLCFFNYFILALIKLPMFSLSVLLIALVIYYEIMKSEKLNFPLHSVSQLYLLKGNNVFVHGNWKMVVFYRYIFVSRV